MKVIARTLPALAMGAAGLVMTPALGASAVPTGHDVHLVTLIRALSRTPAAVQYAVTVRPVGGPAHAATLVLSTRRPAAWTGSVPACLASRDRTALACDLGDLRASEARTLRVTGRPGDRGAAEVPVTARAAAANVPSVTSSLGAMRPQTLRLARPADEPPSGPASPDQDGDATAQSPEAQSPEAQSSPGESPPAESPSADAQAAPSEPAASEAAQSPAIVSPAIRSRSAHPQGRAPAAPPRLRAPARPPHKAPEAPPPVAEPVPAPERLPVVPQAPIIPHVPDVPADAGAPSATGPIGGPAVPLPVVSAPAAPPQIAPKTSPGEGISELNTLSPAGAMQAGRTSWATLVAIAVVAEAGLLWLVAGLTVWRRRRLGKGAPRSPMRPRGRSPRALAGRPLP
jgi:hypothetical protein